MSSGYRLCHKVIFHIVDILLGLYESLSLGHYDFSESILTWVQSFHT